MATTLAHPSLEKALAFDPQTGRVRWTRAAFHMMEEAQWLTEGRYELLDGEVVKIMANEPHMLVNSTLVFMMGDIFGRQYVRVGSLTADEYNEPQPDIAVTRGTTSAYLKTGIPPGSEFRLVIEVSDSTLWRDKGIKAKLYATAGVPEYWVVNLTGRTVIVHRNPVGEEYRSITTYDETQSVSPEAAPEHSIAVAEILPPLSD